MLKDSLRRIKGILFLDKKTYNEIGADGKLNLEAVLVVFLSWVINSILTIIYEPSYLVALVFAAPLFWIVSASVLHVLARIFGKHGNYWAYVRLIGFCHAPRALGIFPIIGFVLGNLWMLCCVIVATREMHKLSTFKAVIVVLIPVLFVLAAMAFFILMVGINAQFYMQNQTLNQSIPGY